MGSFRYKMSYVVHWTRLKMCQTAIKSTFLLNAKKINIDHSSIIINKRLQEHL